MTRRSRSRTGYSSSKPRAARQLLRAFRRAASWHRRKLAVVFAMAAVLAAISAALPPPPPTLEVVRSTRLLDGGAVLATGDLKLARMPVDSLPDGAITDTDSLLGKRLAAPVAKGQVLTELSVASPGRSARAGQVVAPLRLADADLAALLHIGDTVDVIAADSETPQAAVIGRGIRVVGLPAAPVGTMDTRAVGSATAGALVLVVVDRKTATVLARAAVSASLSVVLH
jgi:Flp pilus assembly protein CpaB